MMKTNQEQNKEYIAFVLFLIIAVTFSFMAATIGANSSNAMNQSVSPASEFYSPNRLYVARKYEAGSYLLGKEIIVIQNLDGVVLQKIPFNKTTSQPDEKTLQNIKEFYPTFIYQPAIHMLIWSDDSSELTFYYLMYTDDSHMSWVGYNFQVINVKTGAIKEIDFTKMRNRDTGAIEEIPMIVFIQSQVPNY